MTNKQLEAIQKAQRYLAGARGALEVSADHVEDFTEVQQRRLWSNAIISLIHTQTCILAAMEDAGYLALLA